MMTTETSIDSLCCGLGYIGCGAAGLLAGMSTISGDLATNADQIAIAASAGIVVHCGSGAINDYFSNRQLMRELRRIKTGTERAMVRRPAKGVTAFMVCYGLGAGFAALCRYIN